MFGWFFNALTTGSRQVPSMWILPAGTHGAAGQDACGVSSRELAVGWHGDDRRVPGTGHAVGARGQDEHKLLHAA